MGYRLDLMGYYDETEIALIADWLGQARPQTSIREAVPVMSSSDEALRTDGHIRPCCDAEGGWAHTYDNAVARVVLAGVEPSLPRWYGRDDLSVPISSDMAAAVRARAEAIKPQFLFAINWGLHGPGFYWPEHYYRSPLPGFSIDIITASVESAEVYGYADVAIGALSASGSLDVSIGDVIIAWWKKLHDDGQMRWESLEASSEAASSDIYRWADAVWE